jgi:multisubunit Na+/H+ antiporter MnhB subunit
VSRLLTPLIIAYAFYLVTTGVYSPGGAFGGGVVVGVAACLGLVAEETRERVVLYSKWARLGRSLGLWLIIGIAFASLILAGSFLDMRMVVGPGRILSSPLVVVFAFGAGLVVGGEMVVALHEMLQEEVSS